MAFKPLPAIHVVPWLSEKAKNVALELRARMAYPQISKKAL